jgi:hypothetical protein
VDCNGPFMKTMVNQSNSKMELIVTTVQGGNLPPWKGFIKINGQPVTMMFKYNKK